MGIIIILFFITIILAFGMLSYRAWQIETLRVEPATSQRKIIPEMYFRHIEKILLHLAKYIIQWIVVTAVKYWFIIYTKTKKWAVKNWPKVYNIFRRKSEEEVNPQNPQKYTFMERARLELKAKIRHTREKVRREHEEENEVDKS